MIIKADRLYMCTRFYIEKDAPVLIEFMNKAAGSELARRITVSKCRPMKISGEIKPTDIVTVIAPDKKGNRAVYPMSWGFTLPNSNKPVVNARTETASSKPMFKDSWASRRCIIPASWYYEWKHLKSSDGRVKTGDKYMIQPEGSEVTWLCGLYRIEEGFPVFTVLTREPSDELSEIHDRMPLILPEDKIDEWIYPGTKAEAMLKYALTSMIFEKEC